MKKVIKLEENNLFLENDYKVPISRRKKTKILEYLMEVQGHAHRD